MCRKLIYLVSCVLVLSLLASHVNADLVGNWKFDESAGDIATDKSGNGNNGALVGGPTWITGTIGRGALSFDGADDMVEVPHNPVFDLGESVTIAAWINLNDVGTYYFIVAKGPSGAAPDNYPGNFEFRTTPNGELQLGHQTAENTDHIFYTSESTIAPGQWLHVAATLVEGGSVEFYIDGQPAGSAAQSGEFGILNDEPVRMASRKDGYSFFNGAIDDVQIYDHALTMEEIQAAMNGLAFEQATADSPEDSSVDVLRDAILSWIPGECAVTHDVYLGTVFEDVNDASRDNPLDVLVSQDQTATTYDLDGVFAYGQTYYWRIDEVNGAPDKTIFKGETWSFTVEPLAYPVQDVVATSNGAPQSGAAPESMVDGSGLNENGEHSVDSADMWLAKPVGDEPLTIAFEFDGVYKLHEMLIWNYNVQVELLLGFGLKDVTIEYSENGADWAVLGDVTFNQASTKADYAANTTVNFGGVAAQYIKITVNSAYGGMGQYGLSEVRFLYIPVQAREPQPADGAVDVAPDADLSWRAGREGVSHEVYLSTDPNALEQIDTASATTVDPGVLDLATTYYWKIDEVNDAEAIGTWAGAIWSFSTETYTVVEDFESYTDDIDAGEAIFLTWIDGYEMPGNGSTVGHIESPFAEQTIVNNGAQSMPLFYDNTNAGISEAEYTFPAQNWTLSGIKSLSLYFRGAVQNTGQLYVKINGAKVAYDGDAGDIAGTGWLPWNIDLSTVGGNLSSVTSLTIGVEGAGASGVVYIDDIGLYPETPEYLTPTEPDNANLAGHWSFDDASGTVATDLSDNSNDGTIVDPIWQDGKSGSALGFNGYSSSVSIPPAAWSTIEQQATVSVWMYIDSTVAQSPFTFTAYQDPAVDTTRVMSAHVPWSDGNLYFDTGGDTTDFDRISKAAGVDDYADAWIHWAFTKNAETGEQKIYRNGMLWQSGTGLTRPMTGVTAFTLGSKVDGTGFWTGAMDEFRLYNRELAQEEVLWLAGKTEPTHKPF